MSDAAAARRFCRCEARIAAAILDGYACGNPDCWRTKAVRASFEDFVARLKSERGDVPAADIEPGHAPS